MTFRQRYAQLQDASFVKHMMLRSVYCTMALENQTVPMERLEALYEKVENISMDALKNNQDKRARYDRWKQSGDIASFKSVNLLGTTPMSSRFVQTENVLSAESISLGYNFQTQKWLSRFGLSALRLNGYMNDVFRISSVKRERGITYPFARSVSFSLNASF